jgi:hypothetical protein
LEKAGLNLHLRSAVHDHWLWKFSTNQPISDFKNGFSVTRPRGLGIGTGFRSNPSAAAPVKSQNTGQQSGEDLLDVIDGEKEKKTLFFSSRIF